MQLKERHPSGSTRSTRLAALVAVFVCLVVIPAPAVSDTPAELFGRIEKVLLAHRLERAFFGAKVVSLESHQVVYERNSSSFFMPASNMKLVTAVAAAEILGLDYRFRTTLATDGGITGGRLEGDLVVMGSGDPTLGARLASPDQETMAEGDPFAIFREWAARLKSLGIERVTGDLVGDPTVFGGPERGAGWAWDDFAWGFCAPIGGLQFNENSALLRVPEQAPSVSTPVVELTPPGALQLINRLTFAGRQDEPEVEASVLVPGLIELKGKVRTDRRSSYSLAVPAPADYFLATLRQVLVESGISVEGKNRVRPAAEALPQELKTLFAFDSPDLRYLLRVMLKVSQNLYAETLLKVLSPYRTGKTFEDGKDQVRQFLRQIGVPEEGMVLADGSGVSRYNLLTPDTLVTLLEHAYRAPYGPELVECLPIGGVDGTLRERMKMSAAAGVTRAKTGSLMYVRCLSGYLSTKDGEMLAFSLMLNHVAPQLDETPERALDEIAALLAESRRRQE
ncbi:MAG: D-alanyl-D-alanine carboxypeptidase/D-alanyl-D-alanine-endopeptidase [Acidobacteriota bacterium]